MSERAPSFVQALVAMQRIEPYLGRYSSAWSRQVLYSTLHHTSAAFEEHALRVEPLRNWLVTEPWPLGRREIYDTHTLRWCSECLQHAYHSFGHQLIGLIRCPLHDSPMRHGCPNCGFTLPVHLQFHEGCRRNCMHCHEPILSIPTCSKWPKSAKFLRQERQALRRYAHWAQRVDRLDFRVFSHLEGAATLSHLEPTKVQTRIAIEAVCPLPRGIVTESRPPGLVVTVVVLDARLVQEAVVPRRVRLALGKAILRHLGRKPLPAAWTRHWRTFEEEMPRPRTAGESSHFDMWRDRLITRDGGFKPAGPTESLRPCMLPLLAARVVSQFHQEARVAIYSDDDLAASIFFSEHRLTGMAQLGDVPGIIVELHNGGAGTAFLPESEPGAAGA